MKDVSILPDISEQELQDCAKVLVLALLKTRNQIKKNIVVKFMDFTIDEENLGNFNVRVEADGSAERDWLIWSNEHAGWWKPVKRGYTKLREEAGRYTYEEALEIVSGANIGLNDIPNEAMIKYEIKN